MNQINKRTLYLDCYSGISGDMMVAALIDLGADIDVLEKVLKSLPVGGFRTEVKRVIKSGLDVCDFNVILDSEHENHDHDMEYLHGHNHELHKKDDEHHHEHHHEDDNNHHHEHDVNHKHEHRGISDVLEIINNSDMKSGAKNIATRIFRILSEAEAKAHGVPVDNVHFHEVGAVDSIVDIISVAVCLDNLNIGECVVPSVSEGRGTIRCQHGILPIPVPAVLNIVEKYKIPITSINSNGEYVTPTGAAIVAAIRTSEVLPEKYIVSKTGLGAGKRQYENPSILRAMIIEEAFEKTSDIIYKLETNIDDLNGEGLGYAMEKLLEAGARDVSYTPIYMKKNRPAYELSVLCTKEDVSKMEEIIFKETTTIGIRKYALERTILEREIINANTQFGTVRVKRCTVGDSNKYYPEYSDVISLCKKSGRSYQEIYSSILIACSNIDLEDE